MDGEEALDIAERLTGERWIPYPSELFYEAFEKADDETRKQLIIERREYLFPDFLRGEPQLDMLTKIKQGR